MDIWLALVWVGFMDLDSVGLGINFEILFGKFWGLQDDREWTGNYMFEWIDECDYF